jgi:hypothetical protein
MEVREPDIMVSSSILPGYELNVSDIFEDAITNNL